MDEDKRFSYELITFTILAILIYYFYTIEIGTFEETVIAILILGFFKTMLLIGRMNTQQKLKEND